MNIKSRRIGKSGCLVRVAILSLLVFLSAEQTAAKETERC
jgi:hypothetical protein